MLLPIFQQTYLTADKTFHCTDVWSDLTVPTQLYTAQKNQRLKTYEQCLKREGGSGERENKNYFQKKTRPTWKAAKF